MVLRVRVNRTAGLTLPSNGDSLLLKLNVVPVNPIDLLQRAVNCVDAQMVNNKLISHSHSGTSCRRQTPSDPSATTPPITHLERRARQCDHSELYS